MNAVEAEEEATDAMAAGVDSYAADSGALRTAEAAAIAGLLTIYIYIYIYMYIHADAYRS